MLHFAGKIRDEDVLNKEEHSSQEGSVNSNAKAPQTSANSYSVAPETDTIVTANGQTNVFDILHGCVFARVTNHMGFYM